MVEDTGLLARLAAAAGGGRPVLLDGANGTELTRRGVDTSLPLWSAGALLEAPDVVRRIHRDYAAAGAELLTANSFRTHRRSLARGGLGDRAAELTATAVRLTREGAEAASEDRDHPSGEAPREALPLTPAVPQPLPPPVVERLPGPWIAGSVAPLEDCYSPELVPPDDELDREHAEMVAHLVDAGADVLLVETMNTVREAVAATRHAVASGLPVIAGLVCDTEGRLLSGETVAEAARRLTDLGPDALAINCTSTPHLHRALEELATHTDLPVGAYGNVGHADDRQGWVNTDAVDPEAYAAYAQRWRDVGAVLIGGCCGTTPAHIARLARLLDADGSE